MWKVIFTLIYNLPSILGLISEIEKMIKGVEKDIKRKELYKELSEATKKARETGNTLDVENIFKKLVSP